MLNMFLLSKKNETHVDMSALRMNAPAVFESPNISNALQFLQWASVAQLCLNINIDLLSGPNWICGICIK